MNLTTRYFSGLKEKMTDIKKAFRFLIPIAIVSFGLCPGSAMAQRTTLTDDALTTADQTLAAENNNGNGIALVGRKESYLEFDSKENPQTEHEPALEIVLTGQGPQGEPGPISPQGLKGDKGDQGPPGAKGLNWRGKWDRAASYLIDDVVSYEGSSWRAAQANSNIIPVEGVYWTLLAQKGLDGNGGGTVTRLSVDGPLSVTNATTTPSISLSGVILTRNGGTGLMSPGPPGSFLRSNGVAWESFQFGPYDLPAGSRSYIQNGTATQLGANFDIGGNGRVAGDFTALSVNSDIGYYINRKLIFQMPYDNLYVGRNTGRVNPAITNNSFFGNDTAGVFIQAGNNNSFFGHGVGSAFEIGDNNAYFGAGAGSQIRSGDDNTFIGAGAGGRASSSKKNTLIGSGAALNGGLLSYATAIGADAVVDASNTIVLGRGVDTVRIPGTLITTGVIPIANGGTGLSAPGQTGSFLKSNGSRWTSAPLTPADVPAGSASYIQNGSAQQASSNFNISGNGAVGGELSGATVNATTQYNLGGGRILSARGTRNLFAGINAGNNNPTGSDNSFFGMGSGLNTTTGVNNTFVGVFAGSKNAAGDHNTIIGADANLSAENLSYATAVGAGVIVNASNTMVLGRSVDTVRVPGNLVVSGTVAKGGGSFKIDHPLDPENLTLSHSFVESPDMMNIYNGEVTLDRRGRATVTLPDYFEALNRDFRYQLTAIGAPAPNLYVATRIKGNQFRIAGGKPGMTISWLVTGVRHDAYAEAHRIPVEEEKSESERGVYLHPDVYERSTSRTISRRNQR